MKEPPRLTIQFFLRVMLVFAVFPLMFWAVFAAICISASSYLISALMLNYGEAIAANGALVLSLLPLVAGIIGCAVGLKISSRIFSREQMYEILVGLRPTPRSIKSADKILNRLYPN